MRLALAILFCALGFTPMAAGPTTGPARLGGEEIGRWLAAQTNLTTWSAAFRQTRHLKAFTEPLISTGRVWFAAPGSFRWELGGAPPQSIAIGAGGRLSLVYPRLKRAETYDLGGEGERSPWRDSLALIQVGFPRSLEEVEGQFRVLRVAKVEAGEVIGLEPRAAGTRRWIPEIEITIGPGGNLMATELIFADGSRMRNDFMEARHNPPLDPGLFDAKPPEGFKVTSPLGP